jgi:carbon storage regulator CsrA
MEGTVMLVITRRYGERTVIRCGKHEITVFVREFHGNQIKLCIDAPPPVDVLREELTASAEQDP